MNKYSNLAYLLGDETVSENWKGWMCFCLVECLLSFSRLCNKCFYVFKVCLEGIIFYVCDNRNTCHLVIKLL